MTPLLSIALAFLNSASSPEVARSAEATVRPQRPSPAEPEVSEVQAAAARCSDPVAASRGLANRRAAALLPSVTAELRFDDRSYRIAGLQSSGEVDYTRYAPGWSARIRATWNLGALLAPAGRITEKGLLDAARRREEAVRGATALYFERRRRRLVLEAAPPPEPAARAVAELEIERLGADLDALTCGALARWLR